MSEIRLAIVGVGNCASALVQGLEYYRQSDRPGLIEDQIGGYRVAHVKVVAAFDIDRRKVGRPLAEAVRALPNCTPWFAGELSDPGPEVLTGHQLDGVASHMAEYGPEVSFLPSDLPPVECGESTQRKPRRCLDQLSPSRLRASSEIL